MLNTLCDVFSSRGLFLDQQEEASRLSSNTLYEQKEKTRNFSTPNTAALTTNMAWDFPEPNLTGQDDWETIEPHSRLAEKDLSILSCWSHLINPHDILMALHK